MCYVTATELKKNLSHYIELSKTEDVYITKNNKIVSILVNPYDRSFYNFMKLEGCLAQYDNGENYDEMIAEEILKK